jgi:hypothetical protein
MKTFSFLILFFPALAALSQTDSTILSYHGAQIVYEDTVIVPHTSKDILYSAAKKWLADSFRNAKSVIQTDDKESGQIVGTGVTNVSGEINWAYVFSSDLVFNILINVKDDKYRIRFYDIKRRTFGEQGNILDTELENFDVKRRSGNKRNKKNWEVQVVAINKQFEFMIEGFNKAVQEYKSDQF